MYSANTHILLIDSNSAHQTVIEKMINKSHISCELRIANCAEQALSILHSQISYNDELGLLPRLIIINHQLPSMQTAQLIEHIHNDFNLKHLPIMILKNQQLNNVNSIHIKSPPNTLNAIEA